MVRALPVLLLAVLLGAGCPAPWPVGEPRPIAADDVTSDDDDDANDDDDSGGDDDDSAGDDDDSAGDNDGDGVLAGLDCDDNDPLVYPGADEVFCDSVDQDCDGADACGADLCALAGSSMGTLEPGETTSYTADVLATQMHGGGGCLDDDGDFASGGPWPFAIVSFQADELFGDSYILRSSDPNVQVDTNLIVLDANCNCIDWGNDVPGIGTNASSTRSTANFVPTTTTTYLLVSALNEVTGPVLIQALGN